MDVGEVDSYKNQVYQQRTTLGPLIGDEDGHPEQSSASEAELVFLGHADACDVGSMALAGIKGLNVKLSEKTMKTMRSLLANLRRTAPDPFPTIPFRHDLPFHSSPSIPTGYDTSWQPARLENYSSNPLLRLPNELLLEIMERLPPPDLYVVRQVSHLFAALFCHHTFSKYHQQTTDIDPKTAEPSVHRLLRAYRKLRGKPAPAVHFIPGVEFNLDALRAEERDGLQYALQRRTLCALRLEWKAPVHTLSSREILTKDGIRRALKQFDQRHPGLLCPHVSFDLEKLMKVFYWHRRHLRDLDGQRRAHQQTEALELLAEGDGSVNVPANGGVAPYEMVSG
ncbi:hypothetical protein K4K61_006228 [Colletotrichum sp. SAR11_59]|nr:hypothetical protein K4K61_006228 [Colletotrichum sp. SAR11_59]